MIPLRTLQSTALALLLLGLTASVGAPGARAQSTGLDIVKAKLGVAYDPGSITPGTFFVSALLNDNDTELLLADLLAGVVTLEVADGAAFGSGLTIALTDCVATGRGARCGLTTPEGFRVRVFVKQFRNNPNLFKFNARVKDLTDTETGAAPLVPPVTMTVTQSTVTRTDTMATSECTLKKNGAAMRCKAPKP